MLFPLLEHVKRRSCEASTVKETSSEQGGGNILIHHSRDTAHKQWSETQVLTLAGVARVFSYKRQVLQNLGESSTVSGEASTVSGESSTFSGESSTFSSESSMVSGESSTVSEQ